jgi:hypothetical protein
MEKIADRTSETFVKGKLGRYFTFYIVSAAVLLVVVVAVVILNGYRASLKDTLRGLEAGKKNIIAMKAATDAMKTSLSGLAGKVPQDLLKGPAEKLLYVGLDGLKGKMKDAEVSMGEIQSIGEEATLPVTIKGMVLDYTALVNTVGDLQSLRFPFFGIKSVSLQADANAARPVTYEIVGALRAPKGIQEPQEPKKTGGV